MQMEVQKRLHEQLQNRHGRTSSRVAGSTKIERKSYYGPHLRPSSGSNASSSVPSQNVQPTPGVNMSELVMQLIPTLTDHILPLFVQRVRMMPSHSNQPNTVVDSPSSVAPIVNAPTNGNIDDVHGTGSDDDPSGSR